MITGRVGEKEFQRKIPVEEHGLKKVGHINPKYAVAHSKGITGNEPNTEKEELGFGVPSSSPKTLGSDHYLAKSKPRRC